MKARHDRSAIGPPDTKISILLMDANAERRALRTRIMGLHGVEVIGAGDLEEATSIWHRDRYDMVLIDIRRDHPGCMAWRDEIKKEAPRQLVVFLVGKPGYVAFDPSPTSYVAEESGAQWGDSLRKAVRDSCESLSQRNSFVEVGWRIAAAKKFYGSRVAASATDEPVGKLLEPTSPQHDEDTAARAQPAAELPPASAFEQLWADNTKSEEES